jgi:hypothetical protein
MKVPQVILMKLLIIQKKNKRKGSTEKWENSANSRLMP